MQPYQQIFPDADEPIMTLTLEARIGAVPKGSYSFVECYCTAPRCDCRRVKVLVLDAEVRELAVLSFGFDPDRPLAGPFLEPRDGSVSYATDLLEIFVDMVNTEKEWVRGMHKRYKEVRRKVSGRNYRGLPFPRPGSAIREACPPPAAETAAEEGHTNGAERGSDPVDRPLTTAIDAPEGDELAERLDIVRRIASSEGQSETAERLRQLILSRSWLPPELRKEMDQAIGAARSAQTALAQLPAHRSVSVYASTIDGAGLQSFHVIVSYGRRYVVCSLCLRQGAGIDDAVVIPLKNQREMREFLAAHGGKAFCRSTKEYLDLRVCQALAEGSHCGKASTFGLVQIAELLGRDQWKGIACEPRSVLDRLTRELETHRPELLDPAQARASLEESGGWIAAMSFAASWYEAGREVERQIEASQKKKEGLDPATAMARILKNLLERRREVWLERLVVATLLLKSSFEAEFPWHRLYHVARVVADEKVRLKDIPLFCAMAARSFDAYLGCREVR